jgi:Na+-transporting methylmalonyl-CoA/oxaloacetate decarboxylase gamma subunit
MENGLFIVLMITVAGMGLLFLTLAFFYGLLSSMARGLRDRAGPPKQARAEPAVEPGEGAPSLEEARWRAAAGLQAAAVAIALARARVQALPSSGPGLQAETAGSSQVPSAWWSLHHQRRLASRASRGRGE